MLQLEEGLDLPIRFDIIEDTQGEEGGYTYTRILTGLSESQNQTVYLVR